MTYTFFPERLRKEKPQSINQIQKFKQMSEKRLEYILNNYQITTILIWTYSHINICRINCYFKKIYNSSNSAYLLWDTVLKGQTALKEFSSQVIGKNCHS